MIMNFLKKVPAGMMIVPLLIGAILNTFCSSILQVGSLTTATFSNAGAATAMGIQLVCLGTTLRFNELGSVLKRGGVLLISKFVAGAVIGIVVGKVFGTDGFLGLSALAIICAVTNSNGSVYLSLMQSYGDEVDCGAMALLSLNDGPFFTLVAMGASGLANIPILSILAAIAPIIVGMILGNLDKSFSDFLAPAGPILIPFVGLTLGAGIDLSAVIKGGPSGVLLGFMTTFIGGAFIVLCDRKISKRPGYAGWAVATTAGNAVAVPAVVGLADKSLEAYVPQATAQVAIIDEKDTVVVAIEKINAGDEVIWRDRNGDVQKIKAITDVPMYHKVAIKEMPKGTEVVKYGEHIGLAACDIHVGEHVHVHNVQNHRENL